MSRFRRVCGLVRSLTCGLMRRVFDRGLEGRLHAQFAAGSSGLGNSGNRVFEYQLFMRAGFEEDGKFVEAANAAGQLGAVKQVDNDRRFFTPYGVEKRILDVLGSGLSV